MAANRRYKARSLGQGLLVALSLSASGPQLMAAASAPPDPPAAVQVQIRDFMFEPMQLKIRAGATVTWVNRDDEPHTVVSDPGLFRSGALDTDMTFAFRFDRPGTYRIICSIHPQMSATIEVIP
jgi:plastocyanin